MPYRLHCPLVLSQSKCYDDNFYLLFFSITYIGIANKNIELLSMIDKEKTDFFSEMA